MNRARQTVIMFGVAAAICGAFIAGAVHAADGMRDRSVSITITSVSTVDGM